MSPGIGLELPAMEWIGGRCVVGPLGPAGEGWQRAAGSAARPGELASPAFAIAPSHPAATNVLEAETGARDPERLHAAA